MRYGLYVRKSTEEDERQAQSIEDQRTRCIDLAHQRGITDIVVFEESRSAKEEGRPEFNRMLSLLDKEKLEGVIAWHPDRLSRNETDGAAVTKRIRKGMIKDLLFVNYYFHNSPEGIMMLQIALSQSQYFSSKLSGDVRRGMDSKIRKGWSPHRAMPGYLNDKFMDKGEKTISPDPVRFPLIRKVFEYVLAGGYEPSQILRKLNGEWGYRSPKTRNGGGLPMSRSTFYRLMTHVFYTGHFLEKGVIYPGKHTPMITLEEHSRIKQHLGLSERTGSRKHEFPYTGMIRCARCHTLITAQVTTNAYGREYRYYRCAGCRGQIIREEVLQEILDRAIDLMDLAVPAFDTWACQAVERWRRTYRSGDVAVYEQKLSTLADVDRQMDNLLTALTKNLVTDDEYADRKDRLQHARLDLKTELEQAELRADRARDAIENTIHFLSNVKAWMAFGEPGLKRACARALGTQFLLEGKTITWESNPLLTRVRDEYKPLESRYLEIKLKNNFENGSDMDKSTLLEPIRSTWSGIVDVITTYALENELWFPKIEVIVPAAHSNFA